LFFENFNEKLSAINC